MSSELIEYIKDAIFPRRCPICTRVVSHGAGYIHEECRKKLTYAGKTVCEKCGRIIWDKTRKYCLHCEKDTSGYYFTLGRGLFLQDRFLSQSLYELKYRNCREYADFFGSEMAEVYSEEIRAWKISAIVPVPTHISRIKERGYNQTFILADVLSKKTGIPLREMLIRTRKTTKQKDLTFAQRTKNMKGAFRSVPGMRIRGNILLIDDIFTTGSTVNNCAAALLEAGAENVYFLTVSIGCEE